MARKRTASATPQVLTLPLKGDLNGDIEYLKGRYEASTKTETVRTAISRERRIHKLLEKGGEIVYRDPQGNLTILLLL